MLPIGKRRRSPKTKKKEKKVKPKGKKLIDKIQVPLSNKFNILTDNEEDISDDAIRTQKQKVSPIVVTDIDTDIQTIINNLGLSVETKIVTIGKKLFAKSAEDKKKITDAFTSAKINFFSHPDNENKMFKAVLTGLPEINTSNIVNSLKETYNITTTKVIMFNTKSHSKLYLCHFNKQEVNMKMLNTIKAVFSHIVKWQPYKPKQSAPTQCYRCCMYGHGASSCMRYAVCMLCSGNHVTKDCNVIKSDANEPIYKCFNCASNKLPYNHKANDSSCPFRAKYEATRMNARDKNKRKQSPPTENNENTAEKQNHRFVRAPQPPPLQNTFAATVSHSNARSSTKQTNTHIPMSSNSTDSNLWSLAEVTQLLLRSINELKQCKSKLDQLTVIAHLLQNACD